jgi:hypothetical protein
VSANDVWAVGYYGGNGNEQALLEHWDGSHWLVVESPTPSPAISLFSVAVASANDIWGKMSEAVIGGKVS